MLRDTYIEKYKDLLSPETTSIISRMSKDTWNTIYIACERYLNITRPGIDTTLLSIPHTPGREYVDYYSYNGVKTTVSLFKTKVSIVTHSMRQNTIGYYKSIEIERTNDILKLFVPTDLASPAQYITDTVPGITAQQYISAHYPFIDDASKRILSSMPSIEFHTLQCATRALTGKLWPMPGIHCPLSIMHKDSPWAFVDYYGATIENTFIFSGISCSIYTISTTDPDLKSKLAVMDYNDALVAISWLPASVPSVPSALIAI